MNTGLDVAGLVRRARRLADLSQRDLAARCGVSPSTVARAESGRPVRLAVLEHMLAVAGLRLAVVDEQGVPVQPMRPDAARDLGGRRHPAHYDPRPRWLVGVPSPFVRRPCEPPPPGTAGFVRRREVRDSARVRLGTPPDHPVPADLIRPLPRPKPVGPISSIRFECTCGPDCGLEECAPGCPCSCELE